MSVLFKLLKDVLPGKSQDLAPKKVLNVAGNSKEISLPPEYDGFDHGLLDIDPKGAPDIVGGARNLVSLEGGSFDAVYCSHNLDHYYRKDVFIGSEIYRKYAAKFLDAKQVDCRG